MPVNKVFQPESTEPLFEVNTIQQSTPTIPCPVEQELSGSVPTQLAWEDVVVISGDADGLNEWLEEYCLSLIHISTSCGHKHARDLQDYKTLLQEYDREAV